ncbi:hypothetical protein A2U01_0080047, partial [Trifolium medium]|nr:hypothetical protein [Trifolium medium]
ALPDVAGRVDCEDFVDDAGD